MRAWAQRLEYDRRPLDLSRRIYEAARDGVIYYARSAYSSKGHLEFVHSGTGVRTLRDEFDKVAWHNEHHLAQIRAALSGTYNQLGPAAVAPRRSPAPGRGERHVTP